MMEYLKKLLREPLLYFLLAGGGIFLLDYYFSEYKLPQLNISQKTIDKLVTERSIVLGRELSKAEVQDLKHHFIDQELLVREAIERGLHLSDGKIRHRLADKMVFLLSKEPVAPNPMELDLFYHENKAEFYTPPLISFEHLFFLKHDKAQKAYSNLDDPNYQMDNDKYWMGNKLERMSAQDVVATLGTNFARSIDSAKLNEWTAPIKSSRGWHLVKIIEKIPSKEIPRNMLNSRLEQMWYAEERSKHQRETLDLLRSKYDLSMID